MNGRAYAQKGEKAGWIRSNRHFPGRPDLFDVPQNLNEVDLTPDVTQSLVFDVDNPRGFSLLNALIEDGYSVVIGDTRINKRQVEPSASPFSPVV